MIETVQIPILLKAIDILFVEGRTLLVERAERRKAAAEGRQQDQEPGPAVPPPPREPDLEVKQALLKSKIDELLWKNHEEEVSHLVRRRRCARN